MTEIVPEGRNFFGRRPDALSLFGKVQVVVFHTETARKRVISKNERCRMRPFPNHHQPDFERLFNVYIRDRLKEHGPAPWSICEARLDEHGYQQLSAWAKNVTSERLDDEKDFAGLVLLALIAEWNRRNSRGDSVFLNFLPLFRFESAQRKLFAGKKQPTPFFRRLLRQTCEKFQLRHAFDAEQGEELPFYTSIQLQYGFSLPHARERLRDWLGGSKRPEVSLRLLDREGPYRSASFDRLVRDMKSYRQRYLPESDFRQTLRHNPWVLPEWEDEIVTLVDKVPQESLESEPRARLSDPEIIWNDGPEAWCRLRPLPGRLTAPRYLLRCDGDDIARYYRRQSGKFEADRRKARIPLNRPEAIVTLETPDGETADTQTICVWDPKAIAQTRPVGRQAKKAEDRVLGGEQVLITSTQAKATPSPSAWRVLGPKEGRTRWWLLNGKEKVRVEDDGGVWNGEPPPPPPAWTNGISIALESTYSFFKIGDQVSFRIRIDGDSDVEIINAVCAGRPLSFVDDSRTRTRPMPVNAEMSGKCSFRFDVNRFGKSAIIQRELDLPIRTMIWDDDGSEIPQKDTLSCFDAMDRPVRWLSNGPALLMEGREILGSLPTSRTTRIRHVLGTGEKLFMIDRAFNTSDHFQLAQSVVDTGCARSLEPQNNYFRLTLRRWLPPSEQRRLVLWSPRHGMAILDASEIADYEEHRAWIFRTPWKTNTTSTLLAAIAYEGTCIGTAWCGSEQQFYCPHDSDSEKAAARIALIRWSRLPGLRPDPNEKRYPLIGQLARCRPLEMIRVALLDEGLPSDLELMFEDRQSPRGELFNVIFREAYVGIELKQQSMAAVFPALKLNAFDRLMTYHPILGLRVLQSAPPTRTSLSKMRLRMLSLGGDADAQAIANREVELLDRARVAFCENGEPIDSIILRRDLVLPTENYLFNRSRLQHSHEANLRTALGVAPFREYLAAIILRHLLGRST